MEENRQTIFEPILGKDETIIEVFKPNKIREVLIKSIFSSLFLLLFGGIPFTFGLLGLLNVIEFTSDIYDDFGNIIGTQPDPLAALPILIFGCIILLGAVVSVLLAVFSYRKKWFCYTNKRIIIRNGIIGTDYQTLDYDLIGGISVNVSFLDKLVKPETGTISFASAAMPVQNTKGISCYAFTSIEHPYDVYKRIKEYFDEAKLNK